MEGVGKSCDIGQSVQVHTPRCFLCVLCKSFSCISLGSILVSHEVGDDQRQLPVSIDLCCFPCKRFPSVRNQCDLAKHSWRCYRHTERADPARGLRQQNLHAQGGPGKGEEEIRGLLIFLARGRSVHTVHTYKDILYEVVAPTWKFVVPCRAAGIGNVDEIPCCVSYECDA
jgi:hypothetical protein